VTLDYGSNGTLTLGNEPYLYPGANYYCYYVLTPPSGGQTKVLLTALDIPEVDAFWIYNNLVSYYFTGKLSDYTLSEREIIINDWFYVELDVGSTGEGKGYEVQYVVLCDVSCILANLPYPLSVYETEICSTIPTDAPLCTIFSIQSFTNSSGVIDDGSGDSNYVNNVDCNWEL